MAETDDRVPALRRLPAQLAWPAGFWLLAVLAVPLGWVVVTSFMARGTYGGVVAAWNLGNYARVVDGLYLKVLGHSLWLSTLTTMSCLVLGYPLAYWLATAGARLKPWLVMAVVLPFWTNFVIRAYAIKVSLGLAPAAWELQNSPLAVWIGMVSTYLPFLVLPCWVALERLDWSLLEAARDLGASGRRVLLQVLLPLTRRGWVAGMIFVATPALGEFVIPDVLGGARTLLIGNLVADQFLMTRDWPFGSALSVLLLAAATLGFWLERRLESSRSAQGSGGAKPRTPLRARLLAVPALLLLLGPLGVLVGQSFVGPGGLTWDWYRAALGNEAVLESLLRSLRVGLGSALLASVLGTAAALALVRSRFLGRPALEATAGISLLMPDIVLGLSLLAWFSSLGVRLGEATIVAGHATLSLPYVILGVRARFQEFDWSLEEAAADLGASRRRIFGKVVLPLLMPAVLAGALMAFTLSFDDFLVAFFTAGPGVDTFPMKIYSMVRFGVSREINALSSLLLVSTLVLALGLNRGLKLTRNLR